MSKQDARTKLVSGTVSRPSKANHVETILYEIDMLNYCFDRLCERWQAKGKDYYLWAEGFLLHYRNLIEFFANHGRGLKAGKTEDWSPRKLSRDELASMQHIRPFKDHHQAISRYLTHCDKIRAEEDRGWQHIEMYEKIKPLLASFRTLFPSSPGAVRTEEMLSGAHMSTATTSILSPSIWEPGLIAPAPRKPNK